ncbi:transcription factor Adf-1-like [Aphis craccivora]|uniref:Transcription factor Adf-1-like n=1 Tax=Aphis craccivora TaxID=307492 RepID=A0A6G0VSQ8_APHCR|nr:transcription factor Adf-1-like [Aphis craccivora]KAF0707776.1 transcription factor Adf-1-like [Aphis craccivora]KAF0709991.1 transcription factor Adf-1-like [Aphis craccivora]KAF0756169.1 transcription factor Adf-1-like [Aphis craccivora]
MDITDTDISNASTTDYIRPEHAEENLQDNDKQDQTENTTSDLASTSYAGKRIRSKEDKMSVILAKRSKDTKDTILRIQEQNN